MYWPQRMVLNAADAVVTVSETSKRQFEAVRLTKRPVVVVPNAPQRLAELLPPASVADRDATVSPRNLVYMGSFMPYKNVETLVRAMEWLPGYRLHLLSRISPARRAELEALAAAGAELVFHDGVSDAEYAQLLNDHAVLVTLSLDEGYGLPLAEALGFGVPAVVSELPIFREVAGSAALFVPARDALAFAAAVRSLDDAAARKALIVAGHAKAEKFSWGRSAETLLSLVGSLFEGHPE
jgi:glycosyltransferase involved in cell wall biosynthesis